MFWMTTSVVRTESDRRKPNKPRQPTAKNCFDESNQRVSTLWRAAIVLCFYISTIRYEAEAAEWNGLLGDGLGRVIPSETVDATRSDTDASFDEAAIQSHASQMSSIEADAAGAAGAILLAVSAKPLPLIHPAYPVQRIN